MTSAFQTLALAKSPIAAWPLEAGSGTDLSGNANNMTAVGTPGATGAPLVVGGGPSSTFDGSTSGFRAAYAAGWAALGLMPTTAPFSFFAWVAPSSLQGVSMFGMTQYWSWGCKTNGQINFMAGGSTTNPNTLYTVVSQSAGAWTSPYPYLLGFSFDPVAGEAVVTVNGRYAYSIPLTSMSTAGTYSIFAAHDPNGSTWFAGAIGHFYVYNRAVSVGEMAELYQVGAVHAPVAFTDIWDLQTHGIPAAGQNVLNAAGVFQGVVTSPGMPVVPITAATHPKGPVVGYCARCGGRMEANEAQIQHVVGPGAGLGGVGRLQPIHHGCRRLRPLSSPMYTASNPPSTYRQFCDAYARTAFDMMQAYFVRHSPSKTSYMSVNGQPQSPAFTGLIAGPGPFNTRDYFGYAAVCATLHSYYKLSRNHWTRHLAELVVDQFIAQKQVPLTPPGSSPGQGSQGGGTSPLYSQNAVDLGGSGAIDWYNASTLGAQTSAYNTQDDFYIFNFGAVIFLLAPWVDKAKLATWRAAFLQMVNWYIGPSGGTVAYINSNRNLGPIVAYWFAYQLTGNPGYLQAYEAAWAFNLAPPPLPSSSAGIAKQYPAWYALNVQNWGSGSMPNYNSYPSMAGYGWVQTTPSVLPDGSDGAGYFPESGAGVVGPNGSAAPGFDGDYSQIQLEHIISLWCWTKDPRFLQYANMIYNYQAPFVDQVGGQIAYRVRADGGAPMGPATLGTSALGAGVTVIPCNLTAGLAFVAGQKIIYGSYTANAETLTIAPGGVTLGTPGSLTVTTATTNPHAVGENIGETTSNNQAFYAGWNMDAQVGARHNTVTQYFNQWPLISWGNGLRRNNPVSLAIVQSQWTKIEQFFRQWVLQPPPSYAYSPQVWMTVAMLADPNYQLPGPPATV